MKKKSVKNLSIRKPLKVTKGELDYLGGTIEDGMFRILPTLIITNYYFKLIIG